MNSKTPIILAVTFLAISTTLIIISYAVPSWILVKSISDNYGVWYACKANLSTCYKWYDNGQTVLNYSMTGTFLFYQ